MELQHAHDTATDIAREAGALLREGSGRQIASQTKSSAIDLVTEYDTAAEQLIISRLHAAFPRHQIAAEESGYHQGEDDRFRWYIDPLDGTTNFAHGYPHFAVSLALYDEEQPLVGVILDPSREECFSAIVGSGAWLTTETERRQLRVSQSSTLLNSLLATGFPYDRHHSNEDNLRESALFLKRAVGIRRAGSAALDLAYVAAGRLAGYWEFKLNPWDVAAGALLVTEAGGRVTSMDGAPLALTPRLSLIASNGHIHQAMLDTLASVKRET